MKDSMFVEIPPPNLDLSPSEFESLLYPRLPLPFSIAGTAEESKAKEENVDVPCNMEHQEN